MTEEVASLCVYNEDPKERYQAITCNYTLPRSNVSLSATFGDTRQEDGLKQSTTWDSAADAWSQDFMESALDRKMSSIGFTKQIPAIVSNFTFVQLDPVNWRDYVYLTEPMMEERLASNPPVKRAMQCSMQVCARILEKPEYANSTASAFASQNIDLITTANTSQTKEKPLIYLEPHNDVDLPRNTTFQMSFCEYSYLQTYLNTLFTTKISSDGMLQSTTGDSLDYISPTTFNTGWLLNQVEDIPTLMQQIADSMTEEIRTSADSDVIRGVAMQSEVFIAINWVWLALPISVTVLTFVLLLCVIVINNSRGMPAWRSSSLALLFHQVDGWDGVETVVGGPDDVKARAKEMKARVTYEDGMLSFSKAL